VDVRDEVSATNSDSCGNTSEHPSGSLDTAAGSSDSSRLRRVCPICNKRFHHSSIKRHVLCCSVTHTRERQFTCTECPRSFMCLRSLNIHMRCHSDDEQDACCISNKNLGSQNNLESRVHSHTSNRPFFCYVCGCKFSLSKALKGHMHTHTDQRVFKCEGCNQQFSQYAHLKQHTQNAFYSRCAQLKNASDK